MNSFEQLPRLARNQELPLVTELSRLFWASAEYPHWPSLPSRLESSRFFTFVLFSDMLSRS